MRKLLIMIAGMLVASLYAREIEVFDPADAQITNYTTKWVQGSNLVPITEKEQDGIKFAYRGDSGAARSNITLKNDEAIVPGQKHTMHLRIKLEGNENQRIRIAYLFKNSPKAVANGALLLTPGEHDYEFTPSFKRGDVPENLNFVSAILIDASATPPPPTFYLKRIYLKETDSKLKSQRPLEFVSTRQTHEIFPQAEAAAPLHNFHLVSTQQPVAQVPLTLKISYDQNFLYLDNAVRFDHPPVAQTKPGTPLGRLWQDETGEYFFSGWTDNQSYIQLVLNASDAIWAALNAFDVTAAAVVRKTPGEWNFNPERKLTVGADNSWHTQMKIPLKEIGKTENAFINFQFVQSFKDRALVWNPAVKFVPPRDYGVLIFNQQPFGQGKAAITAIECSEFFNLNTIDLTFKIDFAQIPAGSKTFIHLVAPDFTIAKQEIKLSTSITYSGAKNISGLYTAYLEIVNPQGNRLVNAVNFINDKPIADRTGELVISPAPKQITKGSGQYDLVKQPVITIAADATPRTRKTAQLLADKLSGHTGLNFTVSTAPSIGGINLKLAASGKPEGYSLKITDSGVEITGNDEPGLHYGGVTLVQILLSPMRHNTVLPELAITDYPDIPQRLVCFNMPWNFHQGKVLEVRSIDFLIGYLDKFVASSKQNVAILDLSSLVKYRRRPEISGSQAIYSLEDLSRLAQWCRDNFISPVPKWQIGSHADWWLTHAHPELREKGDRTQADITHPDHNKIVFDCLLDVIEAMRPDYIHLGGDEWWHAPHKTEKPDELLRGKPRNQALLEFYRETAEFCRTQQVRPIIHEDMFVQWHNGHRYDVHTVLDRLPKDYIIAVWAHIDRNNQYFAGKGFTVWDVITGNPNAETLKLVSGFGRNIYGYNTMRVKHQPSYSLVNMLAAEFAWNAFQSERPSLAEAISTGYLPAAHQIRTVMPDPQGSGHYQALALSSEIPVADLPAKPETIANIPMSLNAQAVKVSPGQQTAINLKARYASLTFLHALAAAPGYLQNKIFNTSWRNWHYGEPAGDYIVTYQDGSTVTVPLRLQHNIGLSDAPPEAGICLECRYVRWFKKQDGSSFPGYQFNWVNPNPDKEISTLTIRHDNHREFTIFLYALTGEKVK